MTAKTPAQRQADVVAKKKAAGLTRFCMWAHPDDTAAIKELAAKLAKRRDRAKGKA